jgi:GNAT superfamily N-acetyltransferase
VVGLVTYQVREKECEIVSLDSLRPQLGIGSALIKALSEVARAQGCEKLWLITTNDNLLALGFYQRRGLKITGVHPMQSQRRKINLLFRLLGWKKFLSPMRSYWK